MKKKPMLPDGFPLYPHPSGQFAKKIGGKFWYFGSWNDPKAALEKYLAEKDEILAGRDPRKLVASTKAKASKGCRLRDLVNAYLTDRKTLVKSGELTSRVFVQNHKACRLLIEKFGRDTIVESLEPGDFSSLRASFPDSWGIGVVSNTVVAIRSVFRFGEKNELLSKRVVFGTGFSKPDKLQRMRSRQRKIEDVGRLDFSADECRKMIASARSTLKACILLGLNCGFGNLDCARLTRSVVDLDSGWINFPRPKTGVNRRIKLWAETVAAIRESLRKKPLPKDPQHEPLLFLSQKGCPLVWEAADLTSSTPKHNLRNNLTSSFGKLCSRLGIRRKGVGFYSLRRTFETIAAETLDQVVVDSIMGHTDNSMAALYRQGIGRAGSADTRIEAVVAHVRCWLFGLEVQ